jgi:hypothetical protein
MAPSLMNSVGQPLSKASNLGGFGKVLKKCVTKWRIFLINVYFCSGKNSINQLNSTTMKKFTFALMALLAFSFSLKAQQFVSTDPTNRNVIIEEFTGRNCGYCTDGHARVNQILAAHPGRVWAVNVHYGSLSPTSYPNLNCPDAATIANGFWYEGIPSGVVDRHDGAAANRGAWAGLTNTWLNQAAECNIAGRTVVNPQTRRATISVEVYYTGNSSVDQNFLTVAMLQDSILGAQSDYGNYNPSQWIGNQYVHMHTLRDIITSAWGDPISPTTQGTLITHTLEYDIPEAINGVEVDLNNISFVAWVAERYQDYDIDYQGQHYHFTATRPILNACQLEQVYGSDEPIYPAVMGVMQSGGTTCSHTKDIEVNVQNLGTETITSMTVEVEMEGQTKTINWEGEMPQYGGEKLITTLDVPFGTHTVHAAIIEANGVSYTNQGSGSINCAEWAELEIEGEEEELRLDLMQDKYGAQITWEFTASDGTVLASGGPYTTLVGGTTQLHIEHPVIPVDECVTFTIYDSGRNGICCVSGQGYYILKDSQGNVLFGDENDGQFGESASHLISVRGIQATVEVGATEVSNVDYTHADFISSLIYAGYPEQVGFECRKVTSSEPIIVPGILNEFQKILGSTDELEHSSIYVVKAFAVVNGETYYGAETTFQTWTEGVAEFGESLKIYPNPTSGVLNIQGEGMKSVEIYNSIGQCVMTQEVNSNGIQLNTESLNNGIYFLRVYANDGTMLNRTFSVAR